MPDPPNSLKNAPTQLLCDLVIVWMHMLFVLRSTTAAPAALLKNQLEGLRCHAGVYLTSGARHVLNLPASIRSHPRHTGL